MYKIMSLYRQRYKYCTSNKSALEENVLSLRPLGLYSNNVEDYMFYLVTRKFECVFRERERDCWLKE